MMKSWSDKGHVIIDLNLKSIRVGNGLELMPIVSYQFIKVLSTLEFKSLDELFSIIDVADCATKSEESLITIYIRFVAHYAIIFASIAAVAIAAKRAPTI